MNIYLAGVATGEIGALEVVRDGVPASELMAQMEVALMRALAAVEKDLLVTRQHADALRTTLREMKDAARSRK
jgi:hypothetical protein